MKDREKFEQELPSRLLSLLCVVVGVIHFCNSDWKADWVLIVLIAFCFVPWLGYVFDSIGGEAWGAKYRPRQGETVVPPAEEPTAAAQPSAPTGWDALIAQERKVLATLWHYQKSHFPGSNRRERWTFTVGQHAPDYMEFSTGFLRLLSKGYVNVAPNGHAMLTDAGFQFCANHDATISTWRDIYRNFSG